MTLDELIRLELAAADLANRIERAMLKAKPGSSEGRRLYDLLCATEQRISDLRRQVRNHPDHSYDGL